jgi:putative aminopeptidase FrvX
MNSRQEKLLHQILTLPTAPFREAAVMDFVQSVFERRQIPYFLDPVGNLVVGCASPLEYRRLIRQPSQEPVRLFIAHMDHPGFHGIQWLSPLRLLVKWYGGSPTKHLRGSRLWLANAAGVTGAGILEHPELLDSAHALDRAVLRLDRPFADPGPATQYFGGFQFRAPVWRSGKRLYTKAADDLVGVFAIVDTAIQLFTRRPRRKVPFLGLLTRGEEVGFVGAVAHLQLDWLRIARRPVIAVSLETSRALPNAVIGRGPVIRLGDRRTVFNPDALRVLTHVAEQLLPGQHQRRVMDGGTCEATAVTAWRLPAIGISIPLGNYHNEQMDLFGHRSKPGKNSRPGGPAPEIVHLDDISGLLKLCHGLMQPGLAWRDPWHSLRGTLRANLKRYQPLLRSRQR